MINKEKKIKRKNLIETNQLSKSTEKNMVTRIITSIVLLCICLPCVFIGGWAYFVLISLLALFAIYEISIAPKEKNVPILLYIFFYVVTLSFIYWGFIKNAINDGPKVLEKLNNDYFLFYNFNLFSIGFTHTTNGMIDGLNLSIIMIALSFLIFFVACITNENFSFKDVCYFFTMSILIGLGFQSMFFVRFIPFADYSNNYVQGGASISHDFFFDQSYGSYAYSSFLFIFVLIGSMLNDIGAYFVGVLFGKHRINERISPKKTWEGFFGGIFISIICCLIFAFSCSAGGYDILPGVLDFEHWYNVLILAIALPIVGNVGDFAFSAIKRNFQIKDFSRIIPGHGGVLDRLDSVLFAFITTSCLLTFMTNGWWFLN